MPNVWEGNALYTHYKVSTVSGKPLEIKEGFSIPSYYHISLTYSGTTLTGVVYKTGGSGGTTIATLALTYSGGNLTSVTKS
jgi:hypothetical protein